MLMYLRGMSLHNVFTLGKCSRLIFVGIKWL